ncbi:MAG: hypothetical protein ACE5JL_00185 [Dehalococcoidia bacterium]
MGREIVTNSGFWFAIGVLVGVLLDAAVRMFLTWFYRPILVIGDKENEAIHHVRSSARVFDEGGYRYIHDIRDPPGLYRGRDVPVRAYRVTVRNRGRTAAYNVAGTLETSDGERRICWCEGNVPRITINRGDASSLDVFGVILDEQGGETSRGCIPTENGWIGLYHIPLDTVPVHVTLRVTAENADSARVRLIIHRANGETRLGSP